MEQGVFLPTEYLDVQGAKIRFVRQGEGEPILFLHGFPETLQTWRLVIPPLSRDFQTIALDLKGCGYSDKPQGDYSPWAMADFVNAFMERLGINTFNLVGTDTGLTVACVLALRYPQKVKKLILMAGTVYEEGTTALEIRLLQLKYVGEFIAWFLSPLAIRIGLLKGLYKKSILTKELFSEYYSPFTTSETKKRALEMIRSFMSSMSVLEKDISKIQIPTLILWAQYERFFSRSVAQRLHSDIKNSRLEIVSDCGHFIQEEQPEAVVELLGSFLTAETSGKY